METDRPHRSNSSNSSSSSTSELFICFTSRLSSSSMKIPSKSILSPGRAREPSQISLSNSLSRRLRSNGSMKGGQASPMFPTSGKKRGCAFENPEPSSPKVTCIGQVRVKTKKQGKKLRTRSKRRGEVSFRRMDHQNNTNNGSNVESSSECMPPRNNQKWVQLPVTICEALRAFGAEFNCFLPCRSSCMASEKEKEEKSGGGSSNGSSCGAVFARWLVAVQEGDGKGRDIELVVGGDDEEEEEEEEKSTERRRSYRRHVFDEIEFNEEKVGEAVEEEEARVSICIPPKNALLLMRCRSDPVKMAALANKYWEPTLPNDKDEEGEDEENDVKEEKGNLEIEESVERQGKVEQEMVEHKEDLIIEKSLSCETMGGHQLQIEEIDVQEEENGEEGQELEEQDLEKQEEETEIEMTMPVVLAQETQEEGDYLREEIIQDPCENLENSNFLKENDNENSPKESTLQEPVNSTDDNLGVTQESQVSDEEEQEPEPPQSALEEAKEEMETTEKTCPEEEEEEEEEETVTHERLESEEDPKTQEGKTGMKSKERESQQILPDCLLLMMCEPKLSMEVSKETWVCSTDFIRWLPEHSRPPLVNKKDGGDEPKKRISIEVNPPPVQNSSNNNKNNSNNSLQPPRSSCSYPAKPPPRAGGAESMASAIEQKLVGSKAYEPFVLTRCKSEPMRTAAKLAPEACFWKNRKIEHHRPAATLGVGAAGVGF